MKLLTFRQKKNEKDQIGVLSSDEKNIYPISQFGFSFTSMNDLIIHASEKQLKELETKVKAQGTVSFPYSDIIKCAPIPVPHQDIICLGMNFTEHADEAARYKEDAFSKNKGYAVYFSKRVNEAVPDGGGVLSHSSFVDSLDYEAELAVIIGKDCQNISAGNAFDHVFGYTIINDISARTLQTNHKQFYFGKSLDSFTPMGPWIVTRDDIAAPPVLSVKSRVNGELRQNSTTDMLIFDIPHIISDLSRGMTLQAGTIIAMGTPAGVGMGFDPPRFFKPGDTVECEIDRIGTLTNHIV